MQFIWEATDNIDYIEGSVQKPEHLTARYPLIVKNCWMNKMTTLFIKALLST